MITNLVGLRIRAIRAERNLTQQQLADLADIPRATIASIEKDDANPSLAVVYKVAMALGTTVDELVLEEHQRVQVTKGGKMRRVESVDGTYRATIVSPENARHLLQQVFTLVAGSSFEGKPHPPGSEEYIHILQGDIEIDVAGECVTLKQGDSARFGGNVHHCYYNRATTDALGVVTILEKRAIPAA
ncbi:MAG: helix-turn-helix transcriptional regulator [Gammaproteobacteria bacterium]|nr:helix-turn-helix transcriptional regulator [Gammaproteobacteria bacterium]